MNYHLPAFIGFAVLITLLFVLPGLWLGKKAGRVREGAITGAWIGLTFVVVLYGFEMLKARGFFVKGGSPSPAAQSSGRAPTPAELKNEFLNLVDGVINQGQTLNANARTQILERFGPLFPRGSADLAEYRANVAQVYECQRAFFADALETVKKKTVEKSAARSKCEKYSGAFFGRAKLLPETTIENHKKFMEGLLKKENRPATPEALEKNLAEQETRIKNVGQLFDFLGTEK